MVTLREVRVRLVLAIATFSSTAATATPPEPIGSEFQVNTYTTSTQALPVVVSTSSGEFIVVWESYGSSGSDTSSFSIQGQILGSGGLPLGGEFQINTYTTSNQLIPAVAVDAADNFLVVWHSDGSSGSDVSEFSIQGQLYDSGGLPVGGEFQVNTYTTSTQRDPVVAFDGDGHFIVVWDSEGSSGSDTSGHSIQGQLYDTGGLPVSGQFQVNTYTTLNQYVPDVASDGAGNFVVVWWGGGSAGSDSSSYSIQGRLFSSGGLPVGSDFQINTYTTALEWFPSVAFDHAGNFLVVWRSWDSSGSDHSGSSIQGQRFDPGGGPIGGEFQVNTYTPFSQIEPALAFDSVGNSVVVWAGFGSTGSDTSSSSTHGQLFDPNGLPVGGEFQVNTYTTSVQEAPAVAFDDAGDFVVVWWSGGSYGSDTSGSSIQGQRFIVPIFIDGFESGDTSGWSSSVP